jgi:DNA uptake protein ComE-like DNA-binding protein
MYSEDVPDLNTASRTHLQIIDQIGEKRANMIIEERNKRKFKDLSDAEERLPSIKKQLTHFKVSS